MTAPAPPSQSPDAEWDPAICEETLERSKETQPICPQEPCESFMGTPIYQDGCIGMPMYSPIAAFGCYNSTTKEWYFGPPETLLEECSERSKRDKNWKVSECFCCCKCSPHETLVGLSEGRHRPIFQIGAGDSLLAGRVSASGAIEWTPAVVGFSQGLQGGEPEAMVHIVYGKGRKMVTSTDQPLMLADGSLTTASRLVPGRDRLMGVDGEPLELTHAGLGEQEDVAYHLATEGAWCGSVDGHLIQADGVVAGDFTLQLHFAEVAAKQLTPDWCSLPEMGTPEYEQANPQLRRLRDSHAYAAP